MLVSRCLEEDESSGELSQDLDELKNDPNRPYDKVASSPLHEFQSFNHFIAIELNSRGTESSEVPIERRSASQNWQIITA